MKNSWGTKVSNKERLLPYMNSSCTHGVWSTYQVVLSLQSVVYSKLLMLKSMWCGKDGDGGAENDSHGTLLPPQNLAPVHCLFFDGWRGGQHWLCLITIWYTVAQLSYFFKRDLKTRPSKQKYVAMLNRIKRKKPFSGFWLLDQLQCMNANKNKSIERSV